MVSPEDASLFWAEPSTEPDKLSLAVLVRTCMSIPIFFEPVHLTQLPVRPIAEWRKLGYEGTTAPPEATFVDGGVVSNFLIKSPPEMIGAIFEQAKSSLDNDFILHHPDYQNLIIG